MPTVLGMRKRVAHGAAIRAIREAVGIPVGAFAVRCLISQGYMSNIELGAKQPTAEVLRKIADELGVPLDAVSYVIPDCGHGEAAA
jgi:transcriptional regulator with XRE-family HTH domain